MPSKFKRPPMIPTKPFTYIPPEPKEFLPPALKDLGEYDSVDLATLELPDGVSLTDLHITAKTEYDYDATWAKMVISYPCGDKRPNPHYAKEEEWRKKQLEVNEHKMAVYGAQMTEYKKAKAEYDAFWAKQK